MHIYVCTYIVEVPTYVITNHHPIILRLPAIMLYTCPVGNPCIVIYSVIDEYQNVRCETKQVRIRLHWSTYKVSIVPEWLRQIHVHKYVCMYMPVQCIRMYIPNLYVPIINTISRNVCTHDIVEREQSCKYVRSRELDEQGIKFCNCHLTKYVRGQIISIQV